MLEIKIGCSPHLTQGGAVGGWRTGCSMAASDNMSLAQDKLRIGGAKLHRGRNVSARIGWRCARG
jgi:hypothetical protein